MKGGHGTRLSNETGGHEQGPGWDAGVWAQPCLYVQLNTSPCARMVEATWCPAETQVSGEVRPDFKPYPSSAPQAHLRLTLSPFSLSLTLSLFDSPSPPHPHLLSVCLHLSYIYLWVSTAISFSSPVMPQSHTLPPSSAPQTLACPHFC